MRNPYEGQHLALSANTQKSHYQKKKKRAIIRTLEWCWGSSVILPGQTCPVSGTVLHLSFSCPAHLCCIGQSHFPNQSPRKFRMSPSRKPLSTLQCLKTNFKKKNLFVWLCQFSVLAHGIFIASCGIFHLTFRLLSLWRADLAVVARRLRFPQHVES